ncbi:hypothetical protein CDCA_CDCA14G3860 [Cyanidium caldarium]|uniref:ABC1 atypical kinase-like domain-containing protein n=1 Tax=Cyanidium caldarium TaxID=2771 RepID=A0AAV9J0C7_CYACA|nr:hypothetical protein CDCA_CDCA14G3860 [Cyanidium caldarium]
MRASPPRQFTAPPAIHNAGSFVSRKPSVHRSRSGALVSVTHQWRWRASGCSRRRLVGQAGAKEPERSPSAGDSSFGFLSGSQRGREGGKSAAGGAETGYQPEIDVSLLFGEEERSRLQFERNVDQLVRVLRTQAPRPGSASRNGQTATNVHTPYRASRPVLDARGRLQVLNGGPPAANDSVTTTTAASRSPPVLEWEPAPHSRPLSIWWFVTRLAVAASLANTRWTYGVVGSAEALERRQRNRRRAIAAWVRESLLALGPTFIKVGQFFSARSDLFPAEVIEELSQLQDSVPAFDVAEARRIVEDELELPPGGISAIFSSFSDKPLAAASLGQVHLATLRSNGEQVVVKVQRRRLRELFAIDLRAMRKVAEWAQNSRRFGGPSRDWVGIFEECRAVLMREIDYTIEGKSADRFRENFAPVPWARIPRVLWRYTTSRVIVQQFLPGIKINQTAQLREAGFDTRRVARRASEAYLFQILGDGFFHADPHPGNLAVGPGETLIYYDFGMMGEIGTDVKRRLVEMLVAVVDRDAERVMEVLVELGALVPPSDPTPVRRAIQYFLDSLGSRPMRNQTVGAIGDDLYAIAYDQPFRFPATFTFVLRAFTTLEGLCRTLDPEFSFGSVAQPFGMALLQAQRGRRDLRSLISDRAIRSTMVLPARVERVESTLNRLERGDVTVRSRNLELERLLRRQGAVMEAAVAAFLSGTFATAAMELQSLVPSMPNVDARLVWVLASVSLAAAVSAVRTYWTDVRRERRWERALRRGGNGR